LRIIEMHFLGCVLEYRLFERDIVIERPVELIA
jgi:hypothetical protein